MIYRDKRYVILLDEPVSTDDEYEVNIRNGRFYRSKEKGKHSFCAYHRGPTEKIFEIYDKIMNHIGK